MKLSDVARALRGEVTGDGMLEVTRLVHPADATGLGDLAVALTADTAEALAATRAGAAVVRAGTKVPDGVGVIAYAGHERMAVATLTHLFDPRPAQAPGVDPRAAVAPDAVVGEGASIGALTVVGAGSRIGRGSIVLAGATIGAGVVLGENCIIHPGVRIADRVRIGDRVIIQANAVIGSDGFSFIPVTNPDGTKNPIPQPVRIHSVGTVVIGDDVEIGASTTIDRATLRETRIGNGTKIDNQVQIAHNVTIGEGVVICGMAGIAGSVVIGDRALIGARAGIADHLTIGADARIGAAAGLASNVPAGAMFSGAPATAHTTMLERYMNIARLRTLYPAVEELKKRVQALQKGE